MLQPYTYLLLVLWRPKDTSNLAIERNNLAENRSRVFFDENHVVKVVIALKMDQSIFRQCW